jgi:hypothetical protein
MSSIRFYAKGRLSPAVLSQLRIATGRSAVELTKAAESTASVAEFVLFKKNHDEVAARMKALVANVSEQQLRAEECVTDLDTAGESCHAISFEVLKNILDEAENISQDLDELDHARDGDGANEKEDGRPERPR